ncbi:drug/metabolite transporter (DMT)-like permease [Rhodoligotrophos appendicifer]|uniref:DMT family transporter n=1 Tax=Rhodoligotrophos appendicifer TaxID=987056 RepID=UPI00147869DC|nr:DMT family transporter [Rhodoligotrophos appendicifer]
MDESARRSRGILYMVIAFTMFSGLDASAKYLSANYPTIQIVFARYSVAFVYAVGYLFLTRTISHARARNLKLQVIRGMLLLGSTALNFLALRYLQLAETASISFSNPLWVCALSVPLLGEHVGPRRWMAVIVGFIGVLIIVRPGLSGFQPAALISVIAALLTALYQLATRKIAEYDSAETTLFYTAAVGTAVLIPVMPSVWVAPDTQGWMLMLLVGGIGGVGHQLLIHAHRLAPAPVLAPFSYSQIVFMVVFGYFIFNDVPDRWTIAGGLIVIGSGLYLFYRERQIKNRQKEMRSP